MAIHFQFRPEKTLEALVYVVEQGCSDMYAVLKMLYFADKEHLSRYGWPITGDTYVAMKSGPVPSAAYDIVRWVRGDGRVRPCIDVDGVLEISPGTHQIAAMRSADRNLLSQSELDCLDRVLAKYGRMEFGELKKVSHDEAYDAADMNDWMSPEDIVRTLPNGELVLDYLNSL